MWKNYIKIAFRSLVKRRLFTLVNLLGLVLGLMTFLGLFAYVATEWSYNDFHANKDSIYRMVVKEGNGSYETFLPPGYADVLETNFQNIASAARIAGFIGNADPIGESFLLSNQFGKQEFTVTGVLEPISFRSDISGDIFPSIHTWKILPIDQEMTGRTQVALIPDLLICLY